MITQRPSPSTISPSLDKLPICRNQLCSTKPGNRVFCRDWRGRMDHIRLQALCTALQKIRKFNQTIHFLCLTEIPTKNTDLHSDAAPTLDKLENGLKRETNLVDMVLDAVATIYQRIKHLLLQQIHQIHLCQRYKLIHAI